VLIVRIHRDRHALFNELPSGIIREFIDSVCQIVAVQEQILARVTRNWNSSSVNSIEIWLEVQQHIWSILGSQLANLKRSSWKMVLDSFESKLLWKKCSLKQNARETKCSKEEPFAPNRIEADWPAQRVRSGI